MKNTLLLFLKNAAAIIIVLILFPLLHSLFSGVSGHMPQIYSESYPKSIIIVSGMDRLAAMLLMSVISILLLINYHLIKDGLHRNRILNGLSYGASFGVLWIWGFLEMTVFFYGSDYAQGFGHFFSGIRDFSCLSIMCMVAGLFTIKSSERKINRRSSVTLLAIPFVSLFFGIFQYIQYFFTYQPLKIYPDTLLEILWIAALGGWIGYMYYLMRPGIRFKNKACGVLFFSFSILGTNWFLFNVNVKPSA